MEAGISERTDVAEYLERLGRNILLADLITLLVGGALSALLAGRTLRPIRAAVETEKQFYANAAHDLRTPLAVMRSEAEVALRAHSLGEAEARRLVKSSLEEIDHMSVMVEQMLDLARGAAKRPAELAPLDLAALVRGTAGKTASRAARAGVRLSISADSPARIRGEAHSLQRAIDNLLENALAYTPAGGTVDVAVEKAHGHVVLRVDDSGIGIPDADLPHITEPFFRGDRARGAHPEAPAWASPSSRRPSTPTAEPSARPADRTPAQRSLFDFPRCDARRRYAPGAEGPWTGTMPDGAGRCRNRQKRKSCYRTLNSSSLKVDLRDCGHGATVQAARGRTERPQDESEDEQ